MGVIVKSPANKWMPKPTDKDEVLERIRNDIQDVTEEFEEKLSQRVENYNFYKGNQWSASEIKEHNTQMRKPYVFNEIQTKIDHIIGSQTQTRLDAKVLAREKGDEAIAELLTNLVKWVEQLNNFEYLETEVFTEGLIGGVGVTQIRWGKEDVQYGYPIVEHVPPEEIIWDKDSRSLGFEDARWMARRMITTKMAAAEMFPNNLNDIEDATLNSEMVSSSYASQFKSGSSVEGRDFITVVEYYEKVKEYKYTVTDDIRNEVREFDDKADAEAYYDGLMSEYQEMAEEPLILPDGTPRVAIIQDLVDTVYQAIVIGNKVISYERLAIPFFPYDAFFCYYTEGDYWAYVEKLIDPQRLVNTFFSQWEYQLGAAGKNVTTVVSSLLKDRSGVEGVRRELSRTAPVIEVKDHSAIRPWPNNPVNPELYQGIVFGIERMMDYAGGKNALGLQENAAESGRAVIARAEQGGLARLPFFDKLRYWRISVTIKMVWYLKNFMSPGQVIRVIGNDSDIAYTEIDGALLNTLREIKTDVIIDEAVKSDTVRERQFQQMKELFAQVPGLPPEIISKILIEFSSLPQSKKTEIISELDFYKEYQQKQAEMKKQQKLETQVQDQLTKKRLREMEEQQQKLKEQEQELKKKQDTVRTKMDEIEQARDAIQNQNLTLGQLSQLQNKFNNKQELGQNVGLTSQAAMLR